MFDRKLLRINEVNFDGSVGQVEVTNDSRYYLYILDGEAISGAKQNRIAERSVIIAPYSSTIVPVNCVERGRWNYNSQNFSKSEFVLHPKARDEKAELLKNKEEHPELYELEVLLPTTFAYLANFDANQLLQFSDDLKQYIEQDLANLVPNAANLRYTPRMSLLIANNPELDFAFEIA